VPETRVPVAQVSRNLKRRDTETRQPTIVTDSYENFRGIHEVTEKTKLQDSPGCDVATPLFAYDWLSPTTFDPYKVP